MRLLLVFRLYHPVKRVKLEKEANGSAAAGTSGSDRSSTPQVDQNANSCTDGSSGAVVNGQMVNGAAMDVDGVESMDYIDEQGNRSRKRKEPDTKVSYSGIPHSFRHTSLNVICCGILYFLCSNFVFFSFRTMMVERLRSTLQPRR